MILVVGSTGSLGSDIVRQLREHNLPVRALVRKTSSPDKVIALRNMGAITAEGDLTDKTSLLVACQGVSTVITTATTTMSQTPGDTIPKVDQLGQLQLVEAAMAAHVAHFIYVSYSQNMTVDCPLTTAKRTVEQRVMGSGMTYTILRPSFFMEVWLSPALGFDYVNRQARLYGTGKNPISWMSREDVARFAVMAVDQPAARNITLELGGPEKLSPNEVVEIFEAVTGSTFHVEYVPVAALEAQKAATNDPLQQSFAALMLNYANGDRIDMQQPLKSFPLTLTTVKQYAAHLMVAAH